MINTKQKNDGITLISLVVTIIVLLILAGVSIAVLTGQNGILTKAGDAKTKTEIANEKEKIRIAATSAEIGNKGFTELTKETFQSAIDDQFGKESAEVTDNKDKSYTVNVKSSGREYTIEDDGEITEGIYDLWDKTATEPTQETNNEIHIYTSAELKWLADEVNQGKTFSEYKIYLENNLDLGAREKNGSWETEENENFKWSPIGTKIGDISHKLEASFEGNNHIIKGVYVNNENWFNGIFGKSNSISNLTIRNSYIKGKIGIGGIVGYLVEGTIENCHNINTNVIIKDDSGSKVGGIVGQSTGMVKNCSNTGKIEGYGTDSSGFTQCAGIAGGIWNNATIENCSNKGQINGKGKNTGGIVGQESTGTTVKNCYNTGTVTSEGGYTGGIGGNLSGTTESCYNTGTVTSEGEFTGGIAGGIYGTTENCYNTGTVTSEGERTGGICGSLGSSATVKSCYNTGTVTSEGSFTGGIAGIQFGTIESCYNTGTVKSTANDKNSEHNEGVGGISGEVGMNCIANIKNCYNTGDIYATEIIEGVAGIVGYLSKTGTTITIEKNYNIGKISGTKEVGGVIGRNTGSYTILNNYYLKGVIESTSEEEKTSNEMKTQEFLNLLGTEYWKLSSGINNGYPILSWQ